MNTSVRIAEFGDEMEAGLARNALENAGIAAVVAHTPGEKIWALCVAEEDRDAARRVFDGDGEAAEETAAPDASEWNRAEQEFRDLHTARLTQKAQGEKSAGLWGLVFLAAAGLCFLLIPDRNFSLRGGMACLLIALIQFFVWKDARAAARELKNAGTGSRRDSFNGSGRENCP